MPVRAECAYTEKLIERGAASRCDRDRPACWSPPQPILVKKSLIQQPADQPGEVGPPLAPIHAGTAKESPAGPAVRKDSIEMHAYSSEECEARFGDRGAI